MGSVVCQLFKQKYPNSRLTHITGSYIIKDLLQFNPHIDELAVITNPMEHEASFLDLKNHYDIAVKLLYWSNKGLDSWENAIMRSFVLEAGFTLEDANSVYPKVYWTDEDLNKVSKLIKRLGFRWDEMIVHALDGGMERYRPILLKWAVEKKIQVLHANEDFSKRWGLNFRQIGCLCSQALFSVGQEGGWLHVAACSGAKTIGIPRRMNPLATMPGYYHNKFRDQSMRHLYVLPPSTHSCLQIAHPTEQRPCNFLVGDSSDIVHRGPESCPVNSMKCEEKIEPEDLIFVLNTALKERLNGATSKSSPIP